MMKITKTFYLLLFLLIVSISALLLVIFYPNKSIAPSILPFVKSGQTVLTTTTAPAEISLVAVGDIMLSRQVGIKIRAIGNPNAPFLKTANILQKADIAFGNLESPFYNQGPPMTEGMVFKAEPETIEGLTYAGFDVLSLANNHFGNQGRAGMNYTFDLLSQNNIKYIGAGKNIPEANQPQIIEKNGIKFAFLAYCDIASTYTPDSYQATSDKAGLNPLIEENLIKDIKAAKKMADVVVVSLHWGTEYKTQASDRQKEIGHLAIDSGASLVLGHHPHVVESWEQYKDGYIFYSLGNFVFDQMWSEATRKGQIAKISFKGNKIEKVEVIPITIFDYYQPRPD